MPNLTSVHVTAGIPDSGTGTVSTIDNLPTLMSAVTQPVSAASLPLPTGAATETTLGGVLTTSDFDTKAGSLTETAPASDTASSGLNGRLQRIAQRLTTLIGSTIAVSGTFWQATQPVSGTFWQSTQPVSVADGSDTTQGAKADAANTATDTTSISIMSVLKQVSKSIQALVTANHTDLTAATPAGTNLIGKVGIDQTTPGTTNLIATTARNLIYATGTNGFLTTLTLTSGADLASLASGGAATLSGGGSSGVSTQTNTGPSGKYGYIDFRTVTAGFTPTAGGNVSIWFLSSFDATNYETTPATPSTTVPALPRPPDCIIPLDVVALGTSAIKVSQRIKLPEYKFKVLVQNNSGAAFGAGNYTMTLYVAAELN